MTSYCFDIDGTICYTDGENYMGARPNWAMIDRIKQLIDEGHEVNFQSARGSGTGKNWLKPTIEQLERWGLTWNKLSVGEKIPADVYVDDRSIPPSLWMLTRP